MDEQALALLVKWVNFLGALGLAVPSLVAAVRSRNADREAGTAASERDALVRAWGETRARHLRLLAASVAPWQLYTLTIGAVLLLSGFALDLYISIR